MEIKVYPSEWEYRSKIKESRKLSQRRLIKESLRAIWKDYCLQSSINGLKHLVDENASFFERFIWIVTIISAFACSLTLVYLTFRKYYLAPLVTTQMPEGITVSNILFPAVGICSVNRISKQAVTELAIELMKEKRNSHYNESEILELLTSLGVFYDFQPFTETVLSDSTKLHQVLGNYDVNNLMRDLTPKCENLLLRCSWNQKATNCAELFDFRPTMSGYCCTFNYLRQSDVFGDRNSLDRSIDMYNYGNKSYYDEDQGLKVLLRFNPSDDFFKNIPVNGAILQFTEAYDFPDGPSGSFTSHIVSPTEKTTVLVSASITEASRDIEHIPVEVRGCLFYDESLFLPFYTHSDCALKCRTQFLISKCNCTSFTMPSIKNVKTCGLKDMACMRRYYAQSLSVRPDVKLPELEMRLVGGGISCPYCYPTCSKTAYRYEFSNDPIHKEYFDDMPEREGEWLSGVNYTGTSIVHVKYANEFADCFSQNVIMKWFDLFSNIGSTCGFITGFSFVSVLEFFYFFTIKLIREFKSRKINEEHDNITLPPYSNQIFVRPIYWGEITGNYQSAAEIHG